MRLIKVATVAINQTPMDWDGNLTNILAAIDDARDGGASIVCMPELCITGYGCEDAFFSSDLQRRAIDSLLQIIPKTSGLAVSVGLPLIHLGALYNCVAMIADGQLLGLVAKRNLAGRRNSLRATLVQAMARRQDGPGHHRRHNLSDRRTGV